MRSGRTTARWMDAQRRCGSAITMGPLQRILPNQTVSNRNSRIEHCQKERPAPKHECIGRPVHDCGTNETERKWQHVWLPARVTTSNVASDALGNHRKMEAVDEDAERNTELEHERKQAIVHKTAPDGRSQVRVVVHMFVGRANPSNGNVGLAQELEHMDALVPALDEGGDLCTTLDRQRSIGY